MNIALRTLGFLFIAGLLTPAASAAVSVVDHANIAQARALNSKASQQINKLNTLIGIGNAQLDELEALYAATGSPQSISGSLVQPGPIGGNGSSLPSGIPSPTSGTPPLPNLPSIGGINPNLITNPNLQNLSSLIEVDLESLVGDFDSTFVSNFLDMDYSQWRSIIADPKEALGDMVMDNLNGKILSRMNLPSSASADISDYLRSIDDIDLLSKSHEIANDLANYYFAHYNQRTIERAQRSTALTAKNTAISEEIEARVQAGEATLNEQMAGQNQLSAAQNEILLNTATNLNEANEALINTDNAIQQNAEELNKFEKDKERLRALLDQ